MSVCPCHIHPTAVTQTPLSYSDCCQSYHDSLLNHKSDDADGLTAESAQRLMRTRYSAFVKVLPDYIIKTTLPAQQTMLDVAAIESWARETHWAGLEIVKYTPKLGKRHAQVEFKAYYTQSNGEIAAHHERSTFVTLKDKTGERWYFLDPTLAMKLSQKQPCICSSGEKFKRCCGPFL